MKHDHSQTGRATDRPVEHIQYLPGSDFAPAMTDAEVGAFSTLALAHIGDGVYELMMRTALAQSGVTAAAHLHRETVHRVNAPAQSAAVEHILEQLTDPELAVYKRGRNAKVNGIPQKAEVAEYHAATGLEALFGWLWLKGETARLLELFRLIAEVL